MQLRFLPSGTSLDIQVADDGSRAYTDAIYEGEFIDASNDLSCVVTCDALFNFTRKPKHGDYVKVSFYRDADILQFESRINKISEDPLGHKQRFTLTVITSIQKSSRRKEQRIHVSLPITLHPFGAQVVSTGYLLKGISLDISTSGLCVLSNEKMTAESGTLFLAEIGLPRGDVARLNARYLRTSETPQLVQFSYEHVFLFDANADPEMIKEFVFSLFELRLRGLL